MCMTHCAEQKDCPSMVADEVLMNKFVFDNHDFQRKGGVL
jgi:hypothetical protein